jgi:predicted secreted acid phosphatase
MNQQVAATLIAAGLSLSFNSFAADSSGLENLSFVKDKYIRYHDSGRYMNDIAAVDHKALQYLKQRVAKRKPSEKLAIILDIDETSLSNYRDLLKMKFGGALEAIDAAENKGDDEAIEQTLELFRYAKNHDIYVFFVTGRYEKYRRATANNLAAAGYAHADGLKMKPNDYPHANSVIPYKSGARKSVAAEGYTIVMNIGDQQSDLAGGYAEKSFKLPNPYYFIP